MGRWPYKVEIKDLLDTDKDAAEVANAIAERLDKSGLFYDTNLASRLRKYRTAEGVDRVLDALYDYADARRIWLGL